MWCHADRDYIVESPGSSVKSRISAMGGFTSKDFYVDPSIEKAESLPASAFADPSFLELELNTIFRQNWILVPDHRPSDNSASFAELLDRPGSRVPFSLMGRPLFLQMNTKRVLNCFPNVCTHAWHPLVERAGSGGNIVCPQHGRQFDSDGGFVSHKGFENLENFPRDSDNLRKLPVHRWGPFLFVCLGEPVIALSEVLEGVKKSIPGIDMNTLHYKSAGYETREVDGNWKQHAWNYMDNYHIRFVHKGPEGLAGAIDMTSYTTELYEFSALQWVYARRPEDGFSPEQVAPRFRDPKHPERRVFALWWFIFPNLTLNFYPWGLSVNQYTPVSGNPDKTEFHWYQYLLDGEKFERRNKTWLNEQVDAEDMEAIGLVSKGARSGYAPRGRFAPKEEAGPHWLHRLIYTSVFEQ